MNIKITTRLLLFLLLTFTFATSQPWVQTKGPGGGYVLDMAEKGGVLLSATVGGLYRSIDNGDTWSRTDAGLPQGYLTNLAVTPTFIYAAGWSEGLFKSADNGLTWTPVALNLPNVFILELYSYGESLYIGCEGAGVVYSANGSTFEFSNDGLPASANVVAFSVVGDHLLCGLSGNGISVGVYHSVIDTSWQWTQKISGSVGDIVSKDFDYYITINGPNGGLLKSSDYGETWTEPLPGFDQYGGLLVVDHGALYTADDGVGILKSIDNGLSWTPQMNGLKPLSAFSWLSTENGLFVGYERGVARSNDEGESWQRIVKGLTNTSVTSFFSDADRIYATARSTDLGSSDGVFFSDDDGENWVSMDEGLLPSPQGKTMVKSAGNLILGTINHGLFIRQPSDNTWIKPEGIPETIQVNALLSMGNIVLAGVSGQGELYRSTDSGLSWTFSNSGFFGSQVDQVYSLYQKDGVIYAGAFDALYKSTDLGMNWTNSESGIYPGANITGITSNGDDLYAVDDHNLGIYKSSDDGATWNNVNTGIPAIIGFNAITAVNGVLYAGSDLGIFVSDDNGDTWSQADEGLPVESNVLSFGYHSGKLFIGTDETAAWKGDTSLSASEFSIDHHQLNIAPNPANELITLSLSDFDGVSIVSIYNILGQKIYSSEQQFISGRSVMDVSGLNEGIYVLTIKADGINTSEKLIIR